MIKLACKVPHKIEIALSGGPDSTAALYFFKNSGREVSEKNGRRGRLCA